MAKRDSQRTQGQRIGGMIGPYQNRNVIPTWLGWNPSRA
jgi:hypothetical protein